MQRVSPRQWARQRQTQAQPAETKYYSLIDLGSDTIKAAVVSAKNGQIEVLGHSLALSQGHDISGGRAQGAAIAAILNGILQEAEDATVDMAGRKIVPDDALFLLPGKAMVGHCFTIKQRRAKRNEPLTEKEFDLIWERATRLADQQLPELPNVGSDWQPHTVTLSQIRLDDKLVNDPIGLQAETVTLLVYGVICQPGIMRALAQLAERLEVGIHSLVPAAQSLTAVAPTDDALIFDIGWSGTDCYWVNNGALIATGRAILGGHFFTRSLAQTFNETPAAIEALKLAYGSANVLSAQDTDLVKRGLAEPLRRWADLVAEAVMTMISNQQILTYLPNTLYFSGGSAVLPGLKEQLRHRLGQAGPMFAQSPTLINLGETPFKGYRHAPVGFRGILYAPVLSLARMI